MIEPDGVSDDLGARIDIRDRWGVGSSLACSATGDLSSTVPSASYPSTHGLENSRLHHDPVAALRKCEVSAVSASCSSELAWFA
jgi:hypothetical protein